MFQINTKCLKTFYLQVLQDFLNQNRQKEWGSMEKNETKERITVKQYIIGLDYLFEEFDKCDYDGSYFTRWGKLGEFELFEECEV